MVHEEKDAQRPNTTETRDDKKLLSPIPFSHTLPQPHLSITFYDLLHKLHPSQVNQIDTLFPHEREAPNCPLLGK